MFDREPFTIKDYALAKAAAAGLVSVDGDWFDDEQFNAFWDVFEDTVAEVYEFEKASVWEQMIHAMVPVPSKAARRMSIASIIMAITALALSLLRP